MERNKRDELDSLIDERNRLDADLAGLAAAQSRRQVADLSAIQNSLPADAALVAWLDVTERSGHLQRIREIRMDCDSDAILLIVEQVGGIACHTGRERCFYKRLEGEQWITVEPVLKNPDTIYGDN